MTDDTVSFKEVFHWTKFLGSENFFHWNVSWKLKKQRWIGIS